MIIYSPTFTGSVQITGSQTVTGDLTVQGNLTAQTFILSSSVSYFTESFASGSTRFGDSMDDTMVVTGSLRVTGSGTFNGTISSDLTDGGIIFTKTAGSSVGLFTNTFTIAGSGAKTDLNAYVYGNNQFGIWTNSAQRFTISGSAGNVGIGTSNPLTNTHIAGTNGVTDSFGQLLISTTNTATIDFGGQITLGGFFNGTTNQTAFAAIGGRKENSTANNALGYLSFAIQNGTIIERMRITSAGNVGIGTTNPESLLHLNKAASGGEGPFIYLDNSAGSALGNKAGIRFATNSGATFSGYGSFIEAVNSDAGNGAEALSFGNWNGGARGERMRLASDGVFYTLNAGVDGTYQPSLGFMYSSNTNETHMISAAVSSVAGQSGLSFGISNGGGSTARTIAMTINRTSVTVNGTLSKGGGSFKIDHPHPSKKDTHFLLHSFIEGPTPDLIYRGVATLVNGTATINIDEVSDMTEGTFILLNKRVQCFTTNESGWDLTKGKVEGNILTITSQNTESTDEISWMVIGERHDDWMQNSEMTDENGKIIVELLKPTPSIEE
jgi:cytoskeletal protein CcmA (bactofilin family)